jgi:hypothetical protein
MRIFWAAVSAVKGGKGGRGGMAGSGFLRLFWREKTLRQRPETLDCESHAGLMQVLRCIKCRTRPLQGSAMPLSKSSPRKMLHLRDITLRGYEREDGMIDVEAHMTDSKTHSLSMRDRGGLSSGEPMHDMWLRVTVDQDMTIIASEAAMDATPYNVCPGVAPNYQRLVGLNIGKGYLKGAMQRLGGVEGCTHLRELLQQVGTVAFQTSLSVRGQASPKRDPEKRIHPAFLNTCYTYNENGPLAARYKAEAAE